MLAGSFVGRLARGVAAALAVALEIVALGPRAPRGRRRRRWRSGTRSSASGEGAITAGLVGYVLDGAPRPHHGRGRAAPTAARGVARSRGARRSPPPSLSFLASRAPDGLEFVARTARRDGGHRPFWRRARPATRCRACSDATLAGVLAGLAGAILAAVALLRRRRAARSRTRRRAARARRAPTAASTRHVHRHADEPAARAPSPSPRAAAEAAHEHDHTHEPTWKRYTWIRLAGARARPAREDRRRARARRSPSCWHRRCSRPRSRGVVALLLATAALGAPAARPRARTLRARPPVRRHDRAASRRSRRTAARSTGRDSRASYAHGGWIVAYGDPEQGVAVGCSRWCCCPRRRRCPRLLKGLEKLRVPDVFLMLLTFMYRYVERDARPAARRCAAALASRAPSLARARAAAALRQPRRQPVRPQLRARRARLRRDAVARATTARSRPPSVLAPRRPPTGCSCSSPRSRSPRCALY